MACAELSPQPFPANPKLLDGIDGPIGMSGSYAHSQRDWELKVLHAPGRLCLQPTRPGLVFSSKWLLFLHFADAVSMRLLRLDQWVRSAHLGTWELRLSTFEDFDIRIMHNGFW